MKTRQQLIKEINTALWPILRREKGIGPKSIQRIAELVSVMVRGLPDQIETMKEKEYENDNY